MEISNVMLNEMVKVIERIQKQQFDILRQEGYLQNISRDEIQNELNTYGGEITIAKISDYEDGFQYIRLNSNNRYKAYLDFWINGERSDLTLVCDILLSDQKIVMETTIEEIHVL